MLKPNRLSVTEINTLIRCTMILSNTFEVTRVSERADYKALGIGKLCSIKLSPT